MPTTSASSPNTAAPMPPIPNANPKNNPATVRVRQKQREGQHAQDRHPDDVFTPEAVTERTADHRAQRDRREEHEQMQLCVLDGDVKAVDQVESVVAGQARKIE